MRINGTDIYMTRGDTEVITVSIEENGTKIPFVTGDKVYFTVKTSTQTINKIFQVLVENFTPEGEAVIEILPSFTKNLKYAQYVYDVQMVRGSNVTTIVTASKFVVQDEVTYE
jgi:hypothetical protein